MACLDLLYRLLFGIFLLTIFQCNYSLFYIFAAKDFVNIFKEIKQKDASV